MKDNNLLSDEQGGGRRARCADNKVMTIRMACELRKCKNEEAIIMLLDAKAAFDRADHFAFLVALFALGVNRSFISMTESWLMSTKMHPTTARGENDKHFMIKHGLNQGTLLAACGWIVHYNVILKTIETSHKGCEFQDHKGKTITEIIAPTIMDDATLIINGNNVKKRAQEILHLHQKTLQILGGCYSNSKLKHAHAHPSTTEKLTTIEGKEIE